MAANGHRGAAEFYPIFYVEGLQAAALSLHFHSRTGSVGTTRTLPGPATTASHESAGYRARSPRTKATVASRAVFDDQKGWWSRTKLERAGVLTGHNDLGRPLATLRRDRDGYVLGGGAALVVLEDEDTARKRGAEIVRRGRRGKFRLSTSMGSSARPPDGTRQPRRSAVRSMKPGVRASAVDSTSPPDGARRGRVTPAREPALRSALGPALAGGRGEPREGGPPGTSSPAALARSMSRSPRWRFQAPTIPRNGTSQRRSRCQGIDRGGRARRAACGGLRGWPGARLRRPEVALLDSASWLAHADQADQNEESRVDEPDGGPARTGGCRQVAHTSQVRRRMTLARQGVSQGHVAIPGAPHPWGVRHHVACEVRLRGEPKHESNYSEGFATAPWPSRWWRPEAARWRLATALAEQNSRPIDGAWSSERASWALLRPGPVVSGPGCAASARRQAAARPAQAIARRFAGLWLRVCCP